MRKYLSRLIIAIIVLLILHYIILNLILSHLNLKNLIEKEVSRKYNISLKINDLDYDLYHGFYARDIVLNLVRFGQELNINVEELDINIEFFRLVYREICVEELILKGLNVQLKEHQTIIIPEVEALPEKDKVTPVDESIPIKKQVVKPDIKKDKKKPWKIVVDKIEIEDMSLSLKDINQRFVFDNFSVLVNMENDSYQIDISSYLKFPFSMPIQLTLNARTTDLRLGAQIGIFSVLSDISFKNGFELNYFNLYSQGINMILKGENNSGIINMMGHITGDLRGHDVYERFLKIPISGNYDTHFVLMGNPKYLKTMKFYSEVNGHKLVIKSLDLDELKINIHMQNGVIWIPDTKVKIQEGFIDLSYGLTFSQEVQYGFNLKIESLQIKNIVSLFLGEKHEFNGVLEGWISCSGQGLNLEGIKGWGKLKIKKGSLLSIKMLGGVFKLLKSILPGLSDVTFNRANIEFILSHGVGWVEYLELWSPAFIVRSVGNINFMNDTIDLILRFNPNLKEIKPKYIFSKALSIGFSLLGNELFDFKLSGDLKKPQFKRVYLPKNFPLKSLLFKPQQTIKKAFKKAEI